MTERIVPEKIRQMIGTAFILAISGDPFQRANVCGALIILLNNAINILTEGGSTKEYEHDKNTLIIESKKWEDAITRLTKEEYWASSVIISNKVLSNIGHLAYKYGEVPDFDLSQIPTMNVGQGGEQS